ncbi:MAG TPA: ADOP family duplicated permease [Vicinamibacterales bacterium]|nr:ADOP family duplicated permease [Vicinamibacterales bacterium]
MTLDRLRHIVRLRLRSLFAGAAADRELDDELRYHLERQVESNIQRGMSPEQARTAAFRALGGVEQRKEECRDARGVTMIENLLRDVRLAARQLRKQPGFAFTAVASLALGIGANAAIFQLLNAISLRSLPVRAPHELVEIRLTGEGRAGRHTGRNRQISLPQYEALLRRQQPFSSLLAFGDTRFNLSRTGEIRYVDGLWVSGNFFETLGVTPSVGRLITAADDVPGCGAGVAVISHALWQSQFGGRPDIVGQPLPGPGATVPIIGVTPADFFGVEVGRQFGVARPNCAAGITRRDHWWLAAIGRLKPGWTAAQAQAHLQGILPEVQREAMPDYRRDWQDEYLKMTANVVDASAGVSPLRRSYQRPLWILLAVAALVLLLAAVNLANLLLARATARQQEFAVRLAIGGTRARVLQQVLTESLLLASLGAIAAVGVALAVSRSIPPLISTGVDRVHLDLSPDWRVFGFTLLVGVITALIFGLAPAIRLASVSVAARTDRGGAGNAGSRLRRVLVAAQVAMTLVLLFGGLLFLRTFQNLATQDLGIGERGVVIATVFFTEEAQPVARREAEFRELDERLRTMRGVVSLAETYTTPLGGSVSNTEIVVDRQNVGVANINRVSPGYFRTLGARLLAGRDFDDRDVRGSPRVAIVTKSFADTYLNGAGVGARFHQPDDLGKAGTDYEVIGVIADQKYVDIRETHPKTFFVPSAQADEPPGLMRRYVVRATTPPAQTIAAISAAVAAFDPSATLRYTMLDTQVAEAMLQERLMARLSAIFGVVALLLAVVGLYGVVSYGIESRRAEIAVRAALGASRGRILSMVLGDAGRLMLTGVAIGCGLALGAAQAVRSLLFGLDADDTATLAIAAGVLLGCGLLSAAWPARRAAAIDPIQALRES